MLKFAPLYLPKAITIVGDGAIADASLGEGRLIPALVLDVQPHPALASLIDVHEHTPPGDAASQWIGRGLVNRTNITLHLRFERPSIYEMALDFHVPDQGSVVDGILLSHGVMLISGKPGDRVMTTLNNPKILVEVPDTGFLPEWNKMYRKALIKRFKKEGLARSQAIEVAEAGIARSREMWLLRQRGRATAGL